MTALFVALAALILLLSYLLHGAVKLIFNETRASNQRAVADRTKAAERLDVHLRQHAEQTHRLHVLLADELHRWGAERTILLNRIQDPAATAYTSNVTLIPSAGDMSMEITH